MKKVAFYTLGCKVNQYESQLMADMFKDRGWQVVPEESAADAYVINSCSVTRLADRKSRQYLRRMKRQNPKACVVLCGCYSQTNPEEVKAIEEVDIVLGAQDKLRAIELAEAFLEGDRTKICTVTEPRATDTVYRVHQSCSALESRTRAMIKVEEGCNRYCSYCVIPYARGPVRSRPLEDIVREAQKLVDDGCRELVLTGINTALYGTEKDSSEPSGIHSVIEAVSDIEGDFRIRLSSLEPTVVNAAYVKKLFGYDKLCHHLHLSVQSGSDRIIRAMNRHYTVSEYMEIVDALRAFDPDYGITTDIIVGFPSETEDDLAQSLELVRRAGYLKVHGFPYSKRLYTAAASLPGQIAPPVKKERNRLLIEEADKVSLEFRRSLEGHRMRVLFEEKTEVDGRQLWKGRASNYTPVYFDSDEDLSNVFADMIAGPPLSDGVLGRKEDQ
ncbi:MAG: tRNA (N(6)-L-threonylcarbamoyladenosine(37)-C(2))-methylthiotransferase MtaB, partial [Firmicutes bacterium]|nr:tRNA (N(6)-L-threonylcarbamoyladenosine(37)-C(2))-methylthiotransferase MtaB [Bacillota bacterium]